VLVDATGPALEKRLGLSVALRRFDNEFLTFEITGQRATEVIKASRTGMTVEFAPSLFRAQSDQSGRRSRASASLERSSPSLRQRIPHFRDYGATCDRGDQSCPQADQRHRYTDDFLRSERSQTSDSRMHAHEEGAP
jgi:hypothetical protein